MLDESEARLTTEAVRSCFKRVWMKNVRTIAKVDTKGVRAEFTL